MKRLKELEAENARPKKMYAKEPIKSDLRQKSLEGKCKAISTLRNGYRRYTTKVVNRRCLTLY